MLEKLAALLQTKLLWTFATIVLVLSVVAAVRTGDEHWVQRGGALIAAIAAGAVMLQIVVEMGLERRHSDIESELDETATPSPDSLLTIDRTARRIERKRLRTEIQNLEKKRLQVVLHVVVCAMVGELLHGFGDLAVCAVVMACGGH